MLRCHADPFFPCSQALPRGLLLALQPLPQNLPAVQGTVVLGSQGPVPCPFCCYSGANPRAWGAFR